MTSAPDILQFIGRFHPLALHLPIALILLLALLEAIARTRKFAHANSNAGLILAIAVPASVITALFGWLLSLAGGYDDKLLQWHKWTGIATAVVCLAAGLFYTLKHTRLYRLALVANCIVLAVASHFGGSLTHGSDYLARYAPSPLKGLLGGTSPTKTPPAQAKPPGELRAFADFIQPMLADKCVECHGPEKSKGSLRLDSLAAIAKGGQSGPGVAFGKPDESLVLKRVRLPEDHEDHMPPGGKPSLSRDDLMLLEWWAKSAGAEDQKLADMKAPAAVKRLLSARLGIPQPSAAEAKPLEQVLTNANDLADTLGISISPLSQTEPWLQVNASVRGTNFGDPDLARLAALGFNIRCLDLGGTSVTDAGLSNLVFMPNLNRLHLERTAISDAALEKVALLENIEYLNLYATGVSDLGLQSLEGLPSLRQLYLWQTKVSTNGAQALAEHIVDKNEVDQWAQQIEQLQARIRSAHLTIDLGATVPSTAGTNSIATNPALAAGSKPINDKCPVTGSPVNASKTVIYNGQLTAFCCDDCKAKFEKEPGKYAAALAAKPTEANTR